MIYDAITGAIVGFFAALVWWFISRLKGNKDNPESIPVKPKEVVEPQAEKKLSLLGKGGIMNDHLYPLDMSTICIGNDPSRCAIVYPESTVGVMPLHCQIIQKKGKWFLITFAEANTWLNGMKLMEGQSYPLKGGDQFCLASQENCFYIQEMIV